MITTITHRVLLLAMAAFTAHAYRRALDFCGNQACLLPNECRDVNGVSVCVRTDGPTCDGVQCETGFECALLQDVCASLPCYPKAYCVKSNPCKNCHAPDNFCQLLPEPQCLPVVQPTCKNVICSDGEICSEVPDADCEAKPCLSQLVCSAASDWHEVVEGLTGPAGSVSYGAGGRRSEDLRLRSERGSSQEESSDDDDDDDD